MYSEEDPSVLPVEAYRDELMGHIAKNQIIICQGETGSGKTTKIPQFFLDSSLLTAGKMIAITQPRRIAAITVAQRVAEERGQGTRIGGEVGYCVRFDDQTSAQTRAKFMTDGILVRECLSDPELSRYQAVMLDEAHERSIHTDILFGLVKNACQRRPDLKVIVTSATLNEEKFSQYFNNCPVINIPGRLFHVDLYHSKARQVMTASGPSNSSYVDSCVKTALKIHSSEEKGHILVFLTGSDEIEKACYLLRQQVAEQEEQQQRNSHRDRDREGHILPSELEVIPLYASLPSQDQRKAFAACGNRRKCVIATNIAETSVTVPGIRFVVDPGYVKQKCYDPSRRIESLLVVPISKVSAQQRAGRAGRTGPGQCYRLYSSECYSHFGPETIPEIRRCNLANTLLYLKVLGIRDVMGFEFMDPPSAQQLSEGLVILHLLGALDDGGGVTSPVGKGMALYPLDPALSRMLVEAARPDNDCLDEVAIIAAMLSVEDIFHYPKRNHHSRPGFNNRRSDQHGSTNRSREEDEERNAVTDAHDRLRHSRGDHFTYLKIFKKFEADGGRYDWCERHFIKFRAMKTATKIRAQLMSEAPKVAALYKVAPSSSDGRADSSCSSRSTTSSRTKKSIEGAIQRSLAAGLFMNTARKCANGQAFRSVPFTTTKSTGVGEGSEEWNSGHLRDMLGEVKLLHLHPLGAFGDTSEHGPPDCLMYQELVSSGRVTMRHVSEIDECVAMNYRNQWSFVSPEQLSGRVSKEKGKKRKCEADSSSANVCVNEETSATATATGGVLSRADDARARYLKRKLEKSSGK